MTKNCKLTRQGTIEYLEEPKFPIHFKISNQISRILLRLINRPEVIVKTASRKPK